MKLNEFVDKLESQDGEPKQMALFYGESFSGKTHTVAQFARKYKLWWFDIDHGAVTLAKALPKEFYGNVELIEVADTMDTPIATRMLQKIFKGDKAVQLNPVTGALYSPTKDKDIDPLVIDVPNLTTKDIIVIDTLTALSDSSMNHFLGQQPELQYRKKEYVHYDQQGLYLKNLFVCAQRLKCHVIFITHQEEIEQEDGSDKINPVGGTRNFAKTIARKFDHVVHCKVHNKKHTLNSVTTKDHRVIAGSRLNVDVSDEDSLLDLFKGASVTAASATPSKPVNPMAAKLRR